MFYGAPRQIEIGIDPSRQAEASMIEGLLTKHAMSDMQKLFSDPHGSRKMVGLRARRSLAPPATRRATAPLARFLGELDTFLGTPAAGAGGWARRLEAGRDHEVAVVREQRGRPTASR